MLLKNRIEVKLNTILALGSFESKIENKPFSNMLETMEKNGLNYYMNQNNIPLKKFAKKLIEDKIFSDSFELSSVGKEIVKTNRSWERLEGCFKITYIEYADKYYLIDYSLCEEKFNYNNFKTEKNINFVSSIKSKEFKTNKGIQIKEIKLKENIRPINTKPIELIVEYNSIDCTHKFSIPNLKTEFIANERDYFTIYDSSKLNVELHNCLDSEDDIFHIDDLNKVYLKRIPQTINNDYLNIFFKNSNFTAYHNSILIENVGMSVKENCKEIFINYLMKYQSHKFINNYEINVLLSDFYRFFETCPLIETPSNELLEDLKTSCSASEKKELFLRMATCNDLNRESKYNKSNNGITNLNGEFISLLDFVNIICRNKLKEIKEIKINSKFIYKNLQIARNIDCFADALSFACNAKLTIIVPSEVNKSNNNSFIKRLQNKESVKFVKADLRFIHDRYFKVIKKDETSYFVKATNELDCFMFDNDNYRNLRSINKDDMGTIKECSLIFNDKETYEPLINIFNEGKN